MKRILLVGAYALGGLVLTGAVSLGAFAVTARQLSETPEPISSADRSPWIPPPTSRRPVASAGQSGSRRLLPVVVAHRLPLGSPRRRISGGDDHSSGPSPRLLVRLPARETTGRRRLLGIRGGDGDAEDNGGLPRSIRERMEAPMSEHLHRRDVWGDDPEERDASEVVEELLAEPGIAGKWHDHPSIVWVKAVGRFIRRSGKRIAVTVAGFLLLIIGCADHPDPRTVVDPAGIVALSILASEYVWARRLLAFAKQKDRTGLRAQCCNAATTEWRTRRTRAGLCRPRPTTPLSPPCMSDGPILIGTPPETQVAPRWWSLTHAHMASYGDERVRRAAHQWPPGLGKNHCRTRPRRRV